jgi:hypothetical protein
MRFLLIFLAVFSGLAACNSPEMRRERAERLAEADDPELHADRWFHFQEELSIGDSMQAVVLSWGGKTNGNYVVLLSDSLQNNYIATTQYRDGEILSVWVDDLDEDHWPEIIVTTRLAGSGDYGDVKVHELEETFGFRTYPLPQLSESLGADYQGHDYIYVESGRIVREFRLYDANQEKTKEWRRIFYELEADRLVVLTSEELQDL